MKPKGKRIRRLLILTLAVLLAAPAAGALADSCAARVTGWSQPVYLRYGDPPVGYVPGGTALTVEETRDGWARVRHGSNVGFMRVSALDIEVKLIGFTSRSTHVYSAPTEFAPNNISVGAGFPVYVVGSAGSFYEVENASGNTGFVRMDALSPTLPTGGNPFFGGYDPKWEDETCMLMLPDGLRLFAQPNSQAATTWLTADTPCYVLDRSGDYYQVSNADRSAVAYFRASELVSNASIFFAWAG